MSHHKRRSDKSQEVTLWRKFFCRETSKSTMFFPRFRQKQVCRTMFFRGSSGNKSTLHFARRGSAGSNLKGTAFFFTYARTSPPALCRTSGRDASEPPALCRTAGRDASAPPAICRTAGRHASAPPALCWTAGRDASARPAICRKPSSAGSNIKGTAFGLLLPEVD
jgi:hypothetical protein